MKRYTALNGKGACRILVPEFMFPCCWPACFWNNFFKYFFSFFLDNMNKSFNLAYNKEQTIIAETLKFSF